jgi:hypothetical protein
MSPVLTLAAATAGVQPIGPLGAAVVSGALVVIGAYLIGARERRRWGGRPPTAQEYLHGRRRIGRVQYSTSQWSQRVLVLAVVGVALGLGLLTYGVFFAGP